MKTKEEVIKYLETVGHSKEAVIKISGYLIGQNLKDNKERIRFRIGEQSFDDFYAWYTTEPDALREIFMPVLKALEEKELSKAFKIIPINDGYTDIIFRVFIK
jgi:hypothetical protein